MWAVELRLEQAVEGDAWSQSREQRMDECRDVQGSSGWEQMIEQLPSRSLHNSDSLLAARLFGPRFAERGDLGLAQ